MKKPFYALLANGLTAALVSPNARVDWMTFPSFDGDAVFARILDPRQGGYLALEPHATCSTRQRYLPASNILETRLFARSGAATITDWLALDGPALVRQIQSTLPLTLTIRPRFGFGSRAAAVTDADDRGAIFRDVTTPASLSLVIDGRARRIGHESWAIDPGQVQICLRFFADPDEAGLRHRSPAPRFHTGRLAVLRYWRAQRIRYTGPHTEAFLRSALVLRGLTYRPTGALVAAVSASLPEVPGGIRQWDYRYAWIRDNMFGAQAWLLSGEPVPARRILEFFLEHVDLAGPPLNAPVLRVEGGPVPWEQTLDWLEGFAHSAPVRIGNQAGRQRQGDLEGALTGAVWQYWQVTQDSSWIRHYWEPLVALVKWAEDHYNIPDAGLWEFRGSGDTYTHSQVMAWQALERGSALAAVAGAPSLARRWRAQARHLHQTLLDRNPHHFRSQPGVEAADAALLTLPLVGFHPIEEPRFQHTLARIEAELIQAGWVYRYRQDPLGPAPHAFLLAGFWLARVYLRQGRIQEADHVIARHLDVATDLGLWAEHVDPASGHLWGNFPQMFVHAELMTTLHERRQVVDGGPGLQ